MTESQQPGRPPITFYARRLGPINEEIWLDPDQVLRQVGAGAAVVEEILGPDGQWHPTDLLAWMRRGELAGHLEKMPGFMADAEVKVVRQHYAVQAKLLRRQAEGGCRLSLAAPAEVDRDATRRPAPAEPLGDEDRARLVAFLTEAPLVMTRPDEPDPFDAGRTLPADVHTDGRWVWSRGLAVLADRYGLPLDPSFDYHVNERRYLLPESVTPDVLRRAAALVEAAATAPPTPPGEPLREASLPGQPPPPMRQERLRALAAWHAQWEERYAASTPFRPELHPDSEDYNLHYVDLEASDEAQIEYVRRAREIMGLDPETGEWLDE
jgi:hypothetical protein